MNVNVKVKGDGKAESGRRKAGKILSVSAVKTWPRRSGALQEVRERERKPGGLNRTPWQGVRTGKKLGSEVGLLVRERECEGEREEGYGLQAVGC